MHRYLILAAALAFVTSAWGHDSETPFADWMASLKQPDDPRVSCCGPADQYYVKEYWASQKEGMAFAAIVLGRDGQADFAIDIPEKKVIWDRVNPTGRGVVFISQTSPVVFCFVPGMGM